MKQYIIADDHRIPLATNADQHPHVFAASFNTGDPDAVERVYEPLGILVDRPGRGAQAAARRDANARLVNLGLPIEVRPRHVYVADDIALLIVDWAIIGTANTGENVDIRGTATDVARRGEDGRWRYIIDNPFGTAESDDRTG